MSIEIRFELYIKYILFTRTLPQISEFIMCGFLHYTKSINIRQGYLKMRLILQYKRDRDKYVCIHELNYLYIKNYG